MSKVNVNTIEPSTGTTVTLGASGDTVSIPSGVTLNSSGANLTALNATQLTSGSIPFARIDIPGSTELSERPATGDEFIVYDASAAVNKSINYANMKTGKIGQVLQTVGAYVTTIASTTYALNMSAPSITPSSTDSKILIMHSAPSGITLSNTTNMGHVTLYRDSSNITTFGHNSSYASYQGASPLSGTSLIYLDSPSSTSAIVYSVYVKTDNASLSMVYGYSSGQPRGSSITVMEILL